MRNDRGASGVEYVALIVVAALILGTLTALGLQPRMRTQLRAAVCQVFEAERDCGLKTDRPEAEPKPAKDQPDQKDECHGFLGCTGHYFAKGASAVGGVFKGFAEGAWSDVQAMYHLARNPKELVAGLKYAMEHPGDAALSMLIDQEVRDAWKKGDYTNAIGRVLYNASTMAIGAVGASKVLLKLAKLAKAEKLEKAVKAARAAKAAQQAKALGAAKRLLSKLRKKGPFTYAASQAVLAQLHGLTSDQRRKLIDSLSPEEQRKLYLDSGSAGGSHRADLLADASPEALENMKVRNPTLHGSEWRRFTGDLFKAGGPKVGDVIQGAVGDCGCMSAMAAVVKQNPGLIEKMIKKNANGTYTVTFGNGDKVTVTDALPTKGAHVPKGGAGWPAILEKAMADRKGGYGKVEGLDPADPLGLITGKKSFTRQGRQIPDVGTIRAAMAGGNGVFIVGFPKAILQKGIRARGIVPNHAYAVVDTDPVNHTVTLANPHGPTSKPVVISEKQMREMNVSVTHSSTK